MTEHLVTVSIDARIAHVTLNRPEKGNALSGEMTAAITEAFRGLHRHRDVGAIVLTGAGKHFCVGADLSGDSALAPDAADRGPVGRVYRSQEHLADMILSIHECDKPVVAAVHGAAVGGGLAIALAADLRVAPPDSTFGAVFQNLGLSSCDVGVSYFLPRVIGPTRAAELMLSARHFSGTEADAFGMLNALVPEAECESEARRLAASIARNSEYGVWMTKRGMWMGLDSASLRITMENENRTQVLGAFTENFEVGARAFFEKSEPEWKPL